MSKQTDDDVRSHLAERGEENPSRFVEDALTEARAGFADLSAEEVEALVEEAVAATRQASAS